MSEVETFKEVEILAADLAEYCKDEAQTKGLDDHDFDFIDDADGDAADEVDNGDDNAESGDGDESGDESDNKSPHSNKEGEGEEEDDDNGQDPRDSHGKKEYAPGDDYPDSETDAAWSNAQNDLLDEKSKDNQYYHVHEFTNLSDFVYDYKVVLKDFKENRKKHMVSSSHYHSDLYQTAWPKLIADYKLFQKNQNKAVNYMVKEFELKKAATAHSRAMQSNSGVVDPLKLHSYKYNDDIFKRLTVTPDGKNHGLMMFIDWSGSMHDKIAPTIQQLMNLTMFCRKVNIPFEVYAFSNNTSYGASIDGDVRSYPLPNYQDGDITIDHHMMLLNFISSKMTAKEYDEGMINLHFMGIKYGYDRYAFSRGRNYDYEAAKAEQWKDDLIPMPNGYNLSSTPLNESIMAAMKMVPAFQKKYNIDKMNTVFLTDGASDGGERIVSVSDDDKDAELDTWSSRRYGHNVKFKNYMSNANTLLTDRLTKKTLKVGDSRRGLTDTLLKVLKLRTGCKVLGFYVDSKRTLSNGTLNRYFPENNYWNTDAKLFDRKKVKAEFRKNKVLVVSENTGYDELYLLAGGEMNVSDTEMATPSENAKKGEIKRLFASTLKSNKTSRVVLNKFISQVA